MRYGEIAYLQGRIELDEGGSILCGGHQVESAVEAHLPYKASMRRRHGQASVSWGAGRHQPRWRRTWPSVSASRTRHSRRLKASSAASMLPNCKESRCEVRWEMRGRCTGDVWEITHDMDI